MSLHHNFKHILNSVKSDIVVRLIEQHGHKVCTYYSKANRAFFFLSTFNA